VMVEGLSEEAVPVGADDVIVTQTPRVGWAVATDAGETVAIDIPASVIGSDAREFHFACGMNMFRGSVVIR